MLRVTVYPVAVGNHLSQLFAGLGELAADRRIALRYRPATTATVLPRLVYQHLWVHLDDGHTRAHVCFDTADGPGIRSPEALDRCDVYVKRSYDAATLAQGLPAEQVRKIIPMGLNYECASPRDRHWGSRALAYLRSASVRPQMENVYTPLLRDLATRLRIPASVTPGTPYFQSYEMAPQPNATDSSAGRVLFLTRVYALQGSTEEDEADRRQINAMRLAVVRALRDAFGDSFIGGVADTPFAREHCPDCIAHVATDRLTYTRMLRAADVCVTTAGRLGSNGWKLPEYVAASRCVVTEPLHYATPVPLEHGVHLREFFTPRECVDQCRLLLEQDEAAATMREANARYYAQHLRPDRLVASCLERALELARARDTRAHSIT